MSLANKFNIPPALFETIKRMNEGKEEYQAKVKALMAKRGIKSLADLSPEEKKDFFNTLDSMHKAKNEEVDLEESKSGYDVKYATSKTAPIKVASFNSLDQAKTFLADIKKKGSNGIISQNGKPVKEEIDLEEAKKPVSKDDVTKLLVKYGNNPQSAKKMVDKEFDSAIKRHPEASASKIAEVIRSVAEEVELEEAKSSTGYDLYHKDFSSAMQHAYDFAKKKYNIEIDPTEIDRNVAMGPRKPGSGKANAYRLLDKTGKKAIQVQVANLDNKRYELNMYKEDVDLEEEQKYYSIVHKTTKKVLSTHKNLDSAKDEHRGMDQGVRAHYYIATSTKEPKTFNMKEDVEQIDEVKVGDKVSFSHSVAAAGGRSVKKTGTVHQIDGDTVHVKVKDKYGVMTHKKKASDLMKEDVEQIDELSKKRLASYINKAAEVAVDTTARGKEKLGQAKLNFDRSMRKYDKGLEDLSKSQETQGQQLVSKGAKRLVGISAATRKLAKEEIELNEDAKSAAEKIETYAKALPSGDIDKKDFMKVASMLRRNKVKDAIKFTMSLDSDPRDYVIDVMQNNKINMKEEVELTEKGSGLWANIRAKRARGEKMRKPGEKGAPTEDQIKSARNEEVEDVNESQFKPGYEFKAPGYDQRVQELENKGMSTSDAQGVADTEVRTGKHKNWKQSSKKKMKEEIELTESDFKIGDDVICKDSGMEGEVVKIDEPQTGKYYTVKREDGKMIKYAPDELKAEDEDEDEEEDDEEEMKEAKDQGASKKKESEFHKKLDTLVHKTFGKRPEEMKESDASYAAGKEKEKEKNLVPSDRDKLAKIRAMMAKEKKPMKEDLDEAFSPAQIDKMRQEYSKIKGIDPASDNYKKLTAMLDKLDLKTLQALAGAKIKFVSGLAQNRVVRKMNEDVEQIDEISAETAKSVAQKRDLHFRKGTPTETQKRRMGRGDWRADPQLHADKARQSAEKRGAKDVYDYNKKEEVEFDEASNPQISMKRAGLSVDRAKEVMRHQKEIGTIRKKREALRNSYDPSIIEAYKKMKKKNEVTKDDNQVIKSSDKLSGKQEPIELDPELKEQKR